jgi:hypothetical protein
MKEHHILNLGAGVQSSALYLMDADGELDDLEDGPVKFDYAIFADTQEEPDAVYTHLEWLKGQSDVPILIDTAGKIGDDLLRGTNSTGQPFASIPAFTRQNDKVGQARRQCTNEYKVRVVERVIRRQILGLKPKQRTPKDVELWQYMGFSSDEPGRAARARYRFLERGWSKVRFPLFELRMSRTECIHYLQGRVPHHVPRSACVFCPYKSNREWLGLRNEDPAGWARAVEVDEGMRRHDDKLYVHRSGQPLATANLDEDQGLFDFGAECEGGCGL